ncbi:MAG: glycosyl transferase [Cenarchaeum symbiont of Oopsacas minuta]|nr:glycosyl transferase [Cenarchaeum symbiont of Oopsacas minuta]
MLAIEIIYYILSGFMVLVFFTWISLLKTMIMDHKKTPKLNTRYMPKMDDKVSVILPARNEREHIRKCLESLAVQDYKNYEIIAIDDSSDDGTGKIIDDMAKKYKKIIHVKAGPKPDGWLGKNWPCAQGRKRASGKLLFFTDADTIHSPRATSMAVSYMISEGLDAVTVMPKLLSMDFLTAVTMPMITVFLNTIYSAAKVNDPSNSTGYFYGSFFIMNAHAYDDIGGHYTTRGEMIEDGVLGRLVKNSRYKMRIISGRNEVSAIWARDRITLWNAIKRLIVPIAVSNQRHAIGITIAVAFLMFIPFLLAPYALVSPLDGLHSYTLLASSLASIIMAFLTAAVDSKILGRRILYSIFAPLGGAIVTFGFLAGALIPNGGSVSWRGTKYSNTDCKKSTPNLY